MTTGRFHKLPASIAGQKTLTGNAKVLYAVLMNLAQNGHGSFGQRLLAREAGMFNSALERALELLEKRGLINIEQKGAHSRRSYALLNCPQNAVNSEPDNCPQNAVTNCPQNAVKTNRKTRARKELIKNNNKEHAARAAQDPRVGLFKRWFADEYKREMGIEYIYNHARDGALVKRLLASGLAQEQLEKAASAMFADPWARDKAGIGLLSSQINKWLNPAPAKRSSFVILPSPPGKYDHLCK